MKEIKFAVFVGVLFSASFSQAAELNVYGTKGKGNKPLTIVVRDQAEFMTEIGKCRASTGKEINLPNFLVVTCDFEDQSYTVTGVVPCSKHPSENFSPLQLIHKTAFSGFTCNERKKKKKWQLLCAKSNLPNNLFLPT